MITIHWVIGDQKTTGLTAYSLQQAIINRQKYQKWADPSIQHPLLHKAQARGSSTSNFKKKYRICTERELLSHSHLWNLSFNSDYFTPDSLGLERIHNRIKGNIYSHNRFEQQIIPYESLTKFLEWYETDNVYSLLYNALEDEINIKIHQIIWLVGNYHDITLLKNTIENSKPEWVSTALVIDHIQNYKITFAEADSQIKMFMRYHSIETIFLRNLKADYFQMWLEYRTDTAKYHELPIEQYLIWQEWLGNLANQINLVQKKIMPVQFNP